MKLTTPSVIRLVYILVIFFLAVVSFSCDDNDEYPNPEVTTINPSSAKPNTLVSITGASFSTVFSENKVSFNGKDALVANASSTQLNVVVPSDAETGPVSVTVNGKTAENKPVFTVESLPSVISSISPMSGKYNTVVTITGLNFQTTPENNIVLFNGVPGMIDAASSTSLTVRVPARAGTGSITVNGVPSNNSFTYNPDIYIVGYVHLNGTPTTAAYWKNGVPTVLPGTGLNSYGYEIALVGEDVYVAGSQYLGTFTVGRLWKNGTPITLTDDAQPSSFNGLVAVGNDIHVAGHVGTSGKTTVKHWKNATPTSISEEVANATASGIAVDGQDVYIVGNSLHANGNTVATFWKNGNPAQLTTGVSFAWDIDVADGNVYTTGSIRNTGPGVGFVSYWKNTTSTLLSPGLGSAAGRGIVVSGEDVYVAGFEYNTKFVAVAKYWKNGNPVFLSDGASSAFAYAIDVLGDDVYVAGYELNSAGEQVVKLWKNGVPIAITDGSYPAYAFGILLR